MPEFWPTWISYWDISRLNNRRKCVNFGLQGSVMDGILESIKSRRKLPNFCPQVSLIGYGGERMRSQGTFSTGYNQA